MWDLVPSLLSSCCGIRDSGSVAGVGLQDFHTASLSGANLLGQPCRKRLQTGMLQVKCRLQTGTVLSLGLFKFLIEAVEMVPWLRALIALTEDLNLVASTCIQQLTAAHDSSSRGI